MQSRVILRSQHKCSSIIYTSPSSCLLSKIWDNICGGYGVRMHLHTHLQHQKVLKPPYICTR